MSGLRWRIAAFGLFAWSCCAGAEIGFISETTLDCSNASARPYIHESPVVFPAEVRFFAGEHAQVRPLRAVIAGAVYPPTGSTIQVASGAYRLSVGSTESSQRVRLETDERVFCDGPPVEIVFELIGTTGLTARLYLRPRASAGAQPAIDVAKQLRGEVLDKFSGDLRYLFARPYRWSSDLVQAIKTGDPGFEIGHKVLTVSDAVAFGTFLEALPANALSDDPVRLLDLPSTQVSIQVIPPPQPSSPRFTINIPPDAIRRRGSIGTVPIMGPGGRINLPPDFPTGQTVQWVVPSPGVSPSAEYRLRLQLARQPIENYVEFVVRGRGLDNAGLSIARIVVNGVVHHED